MNVRPDFERPGLQFPFTQEPVDGPAGSLPWVRRCAGAPYFETEDGRAWTPVGHNEAVDWVSLAGLFRRKNIDAVDRHFAHLRASGVTCLRVMLEYAQGRHRYFERPAGVVVPAMVRLWDDLFALCERHGLRILLTPFDTFWMRRRWRHHPYAANQGGPLPALSRLLDPGAPRRLIKARLAFAVRRWGGSGALFAWDLLNEIHPDLDGGDAAGLGAFVHDVSTHVRALETALYGRTHPQCVSIFGPDLRGAHGETLRDIAFRHPDLDFATSHFYDRRTIDAPRDTLAPALAVGRLVADALGAIRDERPFLDSENGPIHTFNDRRKVLPEAFDEEYFRHMQWAHLAAGGAGGGLRWPYRHPHRLTDGMHEAQRALAGFADAIDWPRLRRAPLGERIAGPGRRFAAFGCGDERQAILWLVRRDTIGLAGMLFADATPAQADFAITEMAPGRYVATMLDTRTGEASRSEIIAGENGVLPIRVPAVRTDVALAVRRRP